ncbi:MAG TPA: contractile injection system protein, VgrG/Pvc8 family [Longimicrobium sp.]
MPEATVYNARPTVKVDGSEDEMLHTLLLAMEMTEGEGGMSAVELRVSNLVSRPDGTAELAWEDGAKLKLGAMLEVAAGDVSAPTEIFRGTITGLEAHFDHTSPPELVVLAEDALQKARMARRSKVHDAATISGIAGDVASKAGLSPRVTGLSDDLGTQVQLNESDLAFLRRMLARHDGDLQVIENDLAVAPRADTRRGEVELAMYGPLRSVRVLADVTQQVTETTTSGWDAKQGQRVSATSTGADTGPGSGKKGSDAVKEAIGARSEHVADLAVGTDAEAKALADAAFDRRQRRFVTVAGVCEGNALVRVGTHVKLTGLGPRFSNSYHVVRAIHRWDVEEGYRTEFEGECAFLGEG